MAKVTLYVPDTLWEKMQTYRDVNWSKVFQYGVCEVLGLDTIEELCDRHVAGNGHGNPLTGWQRDIEQRLDTLTRSVKSHHRALSVMGVGVEYQPVDGDQT